VCVCVCRKANPGLHELDKTAWRIQNRQRATAGRDNDSDVENRKAVSISDDESTSAQSDSYSEKDSGEQDGHWRQ
jgi:hypothetical protein